MVYKKVLTGSREVSARSALCRRCRRPEFRRQRLKLQRVERISGHRKRRGRGGGAGASRIRTSQGQDEVKQKEPQAVQVHRSYTCHFQGQQSKQLSTSSACCYFLLGAARVELAVAEANAIDASHFVRQLLGPDEIGQRTTQTTKSQKRKTQTTECWTHAAAAGAWRVCVRVPAP